MRFKKLKMFVAVALVIFILIVANIIVFGLMHSNQDALASNLATNVDSRKNSSNIQVTSSNQTSVNQNTQSSQTSSANSASQTAPAPQNPPQSTVITHSSTRTRAS